MDIYMATKKHKKQEDDQRLLCGQYFFTKKI